MDYLEGITVKSFINTDKILTFIYIFEVLINISQWCKWGIWVSCDSIDIMLMFMISIMNLEYAI